MNSRLRRTVVALAATSSIMGIGAAPGMADPVIGPPPGWPPATCERHIEVDNRAVFEGTRTEADNTPYTYVTFTVSSNSCGAAGSVDFFTFPGSATALVDYLTMSGTLYFAAGQTGDRTVTARVRKDPSPGGAEVFHLVFTDPSALVTVDDGFGSATIVNDDTTCVPPWDWAPIPPMQPDFHCSE